MNQASAKRRNALLAGAAGVALLIGGSTYALWSQQASLNGGTITAGNLALTAAALGNYDVSADRVTHGTSPDQEVVGPIQDANNQDLTFGAGQVAAYNGDTTTPGLDGDPGTYGINAVSDVLQGHSIANLDTWLIVPGDTVALAQTLNVTLTGDNLVATLDVDGTGFLANALNSDMVYHYALFGSDGKQLGDIEPIANAVQPIALLQADSTGQGGGTDDYYGVDPNLVKVPVVGTAKLTLVVFGHFKDTGNTQGIDNVNVIDALNSFKVDLTQVRDYTDGFGSPQPYPSPSPTTTP